MRPLASRLLLAAFAVLAAAVAIHALHADHRCAEVKADASTAPRSELTAIGREAIDRCGDPRDRALVAVVLLARKRRDDAIELTRRMTRSTPDDYLGWLALWRVTGERGALAHARELNPRGTPRG